MSKSIAEIQHAFDVDGRLYLVRIRAVGNQCAPVSVSAFDVYVSAVLADILPEYNRAEPELVARQVVNYIRPLVPATADQLGDFADVVLAFVCEQQLAARDTDGRPY